MKHFHRRCQRNEIIMGRAEHLTGQQADCGADAFPTGGKQILQGSTQVRLGTIGLGMQEVFDFLEVRLDGYEKGGCVQSDSFQAKSRRAFSLVTVATFVMSQE